MGDPVNAERYWNATADEYQSTIRISTDDYHYGPLLPGDRELNLLPEPLQGKRCLEIGCGAGQNSIFLTRHGADCVAVDLSERQLHHGRELATQCGVRVDFRRHDMDQLPVAELGSFDLVHNASLTFSQNPGQVVRTMADLLRPDGQLLLVALHPLHAGDWIELDDGTEGVWIRSYFHMPVDERDAEEGHDGIVARYYTLSEMAGWITDAGLRINRIVEPEPLPIPSLHDDEVMQRVPYDSPDWRELYPFLAAVPFAVIFLAGR